MNTETNYIITPQGVYRNRPPEFMGELSDLGKLIADTAPVSCPYVFSGGACLQIYRNRYYVAQRLDQLRIATHYSVDYANPEECFPVFIPTTDSLLMSRVWTPPVNMRLFLGFVCEPPGGANAQWRLKDTYLFATSHTYSGNWRLPLPNVYEDARVCMGSTAPTLNDTLQGLVEAARAHFDEASWNTDLLHNQAGNASRLFRFNTNPETPAREATQIWADYCSRVNHLTLEYFL